MKKFLSAVLAIFMLLTSLPAFAIEFDDSDLADYTQVDIKSARHITETANIAFSGNKMYVYGSGSNYVFVRIEIPKPGNGKTLDSFVLRAKGWYSSAKTSLAAYKFPGDDWKDTELVYKGGDAAINALFTSSNVLPVEYSLPEGSNETKYSFDLTDYANTCLANGDTDICLALTCSSTYMVLPPDSTYDQDKLKAYVKFGDAPEFEFVSSTPEDGATDVLPYTDFSMNFNNAVKSAEVFINSDAVPQDKVVVSGSKVGINYPLPASSDCTVTVVVTDIYGSELTKSVTVTTVSASDAMLFDDKDLKGYDQLSIKNARYITEADNTAFSGDKKYIYGTGANYAFLRLAIPTPPKGKQIDKMVLRVTGWYSSPRFSTIAYKFAGDKWNDESLVYVGGGNADIASAFTAANKLPITYVQSESSANYARYNIDLTDYVNECIASGNQDDICFALTADYTYQIYPADATDNTNKMKAYVFYKDAPALSFESSVPQNGAEKVVPSEPITIGFNNAIESATVKVNGTNVPEDVIVYNGKNVTINYELPANSECSLEITANDIYGYEVTETINFTTGRNADVKEAVALESYFVNGDSSSPVTNFSDDTRHPKAVIYKVPLPNVKNGSILESFKLKYTIGVWSSGATTSPADAVVMGYKLPSTLNLAEVKYSDIESVLADHSTYKAGPHKVTEELKGVYATNVAYTSAEMDVTGYARESIAKGEDYMYIALTGSNMNVKFYGIKTEGAAVENAAAKYVYTVNNEPEFKTSDVSVTLYGRNVTEVSFILSTTLENIKDNVVIRNKDNKQTSGAEFVVDAYTGKISLASPVTLAQEVDYEVVILSGATDTYGNRLSGEFVVAEFTTGIDIVTYQPKIVMSYAEVIDFDELQTLGSADVGATVKGVTVVENNTSKDIVVNMIIATYKSETELSEVKVVPCTIPAAETLTIESEAITVGSDDKTVKVFVWENMKTLNPLTVFGTCPVN
ncbi:MAG: Ig-like domain-containing protein [Clostridia bacterium]|nr:Ig-like domain-containing protein [Clostridia bacterium]